jgi:predicted nucleic acid-binding protein
VAAGRSNDDGLDHLGEAASIHLLTIAGGGRLISDDHGARSVARARGVRAASTVGVIAELLARRIITAALVETYLRVLRARDRMRAPLTPIDLLAGALGSWA